MQWLKKSDMGRKLFGFCSDSACWHNPEDFANGYRYSMIGVNPGEVEAELKKKDKSEKIKVIGPFYIYYPFD